MKKLSAKQNSSKATARVAAKSSKSAVHDMTPAQAKALAATRKPIKAEIAAADEFMARTKGQRPFSNLPSAKVGKNGIDPKNLGNALTKANEPAGSAALRRMTKANAKSDPAGVKVAPVAKAKNGRAKAAPITGQIVASAEATKAGVDGSLSVDDGVAEEQEWNDVRRMRKGNRRSGHPGDSRPSHRRSRSSRVKFRGWGSEPAPPPPALLRE